MIAAEILPPGVSQSETRWESGNLSLAVEYSHANFAPRLVFWGQFSAGRGEETSGGTRGDADLPHNSEADGTEFSAASPETSRKILRGLSGTLGKNAEPREKSKQNLKIILTGFFG